VGETFAEAAFLKPQSALIRFREGALADAGMTR
jgi:hypothetical protein